MDYTFTYPSVYMYIPTAAGLPYTNNTMGAPGPSTANWILPLDLYDVSTIYDGGSSTRQLTLSDLGTNCPQSADPTAIATMLDAACDPILAAPTQVSKWAYPCNACGRFGLFDPPYAVPTLTGGLVLPTVTKTTGQPVIVPTITTSAVPAPPTSTIVPLPSTTPTSVEVGILEIVYYSNGTPVATAMVTETGIHGTVTSSLEVSAPPAPSSSTSAAAPSESTTELPTESLPLPASSSSASPLPSTYDPSSAVSGSATSTSVSETTTTAIVSSDTSTAAVSASSGSGTSTTAPAVVGSGTSTTTPSAVVTAAGSQVSSGGLTWLMPAVVFAVFMM